MSILSSVRRWHSQGSLLDRHIGLFSTKLSRSLRSTSYSQNLFTRNQTTPVSTMALSASDTHNDTKATDEKTAQPSSSALDMNTFTSGKIRTVSQLSPSVRGLTIQVAEKGTCEFKPGQWVDLCFPSDEEISEKLGGYSIVSTPRQLHRDGTIDLAVKKARHPVASHIHDKMAVGDSCALRIGGDFYFDVNAAENADIKHVVLIAGGVGINPLYSMLKAICEDSTSTRCTLLFSAKTPAEFLFTPQLAKLTAAHSDRLQCFLTVTGHRFRGIAASDRQSGNGAEYSGNSSGNDSDTDSETMDLEDYDGVKVVSSGSDGHRALLHDLPVHCGRIDTTLLPLLCGCDCGSNSKMAAASSSCPDRSGDQKPLFAVDAPDVVYYLCGPPKMVEGVSSTLQTCGVARERIRYEQWW